VRGGRGISHQTSAHANPLFGRAAARRTKFLTCAPGKPAAEYWRLSPYNEENLRSSSRAASANSFSGSIPTPLFIISCNSGIVRFGAK
jgi:hypothetical protein